MSGLLLHIQLFCQEYEIKHLATDNQGDDFAARFLTLVGFKRCACGLPGLVNDGSQLRLVTKDTQSCGQITTHENNEQALREAQNPQPKPMSTPKESSENQGNAMETTSRS